MKDNTEKLMQSEKWVGGVTLKKLASIVMIVMAALWIYSVAHPEVDVWKKFIFGNTVTVCEKAETKNKEIVCIEKTSMYIAMFSDGTYIISEDLAGLAEKLSEATGKSFAAEGSALKMIDGGALVTVDIAVYRK